MKFSIIIPTLNEAQVIQTCLENLRKYQPASEIILVDGGSSDKTLSLAKPNADVIINTGKGRAKQMNMGAMIATGDVLVFLHADTFLPDNALTLIQQGIESGAQWGRFNIKLSSSNALLKIIATMMNWRSRLTGIATGDQVIFVSRESFNQIGGFPEIALMEDIAISKILKKVTPPCCLTEQVKSSARRWQKFGIYHTMLLMWWLRLGYFMGVNPGSLQQLYSRGVFWKP